MNTENILSSIGGEEISHALHSLPECSANAPETMDAVIDTLHAGRARITFKRFKHQRHKSTRYFWTAERATRERGTDRSVNSGPSAAA
jgi:hypothetical protein